MTKITAILFFILTVGSCGQEQAGNKMYETDGDVQNKQMPIQQKSAIQEEATSSDEEVNQPQSVEKKVIKDGRIGIQVKNIEDTKKRINQLVKKHKGYYANENFNNSNWEASYNLRIRIPSKHFEEFIAATETGEEKILYKEIDARDVTDQFIDLEIRLKNKKNYLKRYGELLKQARNIKEILEIEEKIRRLEEEIESTTGRLKYLSNLVDFSTLNLTITEKKDYKYNPTSRDKFSEKLKQSFSKGWFGFIDLVLFSIKIWPFWIVLALLLYFLKRMRDKKRSRQ